MNAPVLVQQFTRLIHFDHSYRLSYLLRQLADKTGKIHNDRNQTKHKRKSDDQKVHAANISLSRRMMVSL